MLLGVRKRGKKQSQNRAGSCDDLDCTKVCSRKNIGAFALLFYRKGRYDSRRWVQAPGDGRVWYCFLFVFPISLGEAGFQEIWFRELGG